MRGCAVADTDIVSVTIGVCHRVSQCIRDSLGVRHGIRKPDPHGITYTNPVL
jgi:hypothetical protein